VALLAVLILAKPSGAQDTPLITVEPTEVGIGAVHVGFINGGIGWLFTTVL
jgi:hypothetical protein